MNEGLHALPTTPNPPAARDCWQMAQQWGCTVEEAVARMAAEGWRFWGYDATYGTELMLPPEPAAKGQS